MGFQSATNYNLRGIWCHFPFPSYRFLPAHAGKRSFKMQGSELRALCRCQVGCSLRTPGELGSSLVAVMAKKCPEPNFFPPLRTASRAGLPSVFAKGSATRPLSPVEASQAFCKAAANRSSSHAKGLSPTWPPPRRRHIAQGTCSAQRNWPEFAANNSE